MFFEYKNQESLENIEKLVGSRPTQTIHEDDIYYVYDCHNYTLESNSGSDYCLCLYANKQDGFKITILVEGITIFIEIIKSEQNLSFVNKFSRFKIKHTIIPSRPFKGFQEDKSEFIRVFFRNLEERNTFTELVKENLKTTVYSCTSSLKYQNNVAARYNNIKLFGWIRIPSDKMKLIKDNNFVLPTYAVNVKNIEHASQKRRNIPLYTMSWDIETKTFEHDGSVPSPKSPYAEIKQLSMYFSWYGNPNQGKTISLSTFGTSGQPSSEFIQITCKSQYHLLIAFGTIIKSLCPDIILDFNGFKYDWVFVIEKSRKYFMPRTTDEFSSGTVLDYLKDCLTLYRGSSKISNINSPEDRPRAVKLSPDFTEKYHFMRHPGKIPLDMRVAAARASDSYLPYESQSLNYYLINNKLSPKLDMDFMYMDAIFTLHMTTRKYKLTKNHTSIMISPLSPEELHEVIDKEELDFSFLKGKELIHDLSSKSNDELHKMLDDSIKIIEYCNYDAKSCTLLCNKLKIIQSYESLSNLSRVPFENVAFNAGSGRVSNIIFAECGDEYLIDEDFKPANDGKKYDGAYFPRPKVGFNNEYPTGDLDVVSEYPNVAAAYNLSPEKCIFNPNIAEELKDKGHEILEINYKYGIPDTDRPSYTTWFIQFNKSKEHYGEGMGIFPRVLRRLFDTRKRMNRLIGLIKFDLIPKLTGTSVDEILKNNIQITITEELIKKFEDLLNTSDTYKPFINDFNDIDTNNLIEDLLWMIGDLDIKQLGRKIMMNTFYGTAGSKYNHLFLVQVSAAITAKARDTTKEIESVALSHGFEVVYGDTDSIYAIPPKERFDDSLEKYKSNLISKQEHWSNMIKITVNSLKELQKHVNQRLAEVSRTNFVEVTFERVLFPMLICGLKYYLGGLYDEKENKSLDLSLATTDEEFNKAGFIDKRLYRRGQLITKNTNNYTKDFVISFLRRIFHIDGSSDLLETLKNVISEMKFNYPINSEEDMQPFIKRAKYKENKSASHHIAQFIARMNELKTIIPSLTLPVIGEQFRYLMMKLPKDPLIPKSKDKRSHNYIMINNVYNKDLINYYGIDKFELDIKSYFETLIKMASKLVFTQSGFFNNEILDISFSDNRKKYSDVMKKNVQDTSTKLFELFKDYLPKGVPKTDIISLVKPKVLMLYQDEKINTLTFELLDIACSKSSIYMWRRFCKYVELFLINVSHNKSNLFIPSKLPPKNTFDNTIVKLKFAVRESINDLWKKLGLVRTNPKLDVVFDDFKSIIELFQKRVELMYRFCMFKHICCGLTNDSYKEILSMLK